MTVEVTRSGLVEAVHPVCAAAVDRSGRLLGSLGADLDREFFGRSVFKPFQAHVSQRHGAGLSAEQLAVAAASHAGQPVHIALVTVMLSEAGLSATDLLCPPARPASPGADRLAAAWGSGHPAPVFHNCSGKHAAMLRACRASGWSLAYAAADHPLQMEVVAIVEAMTGRRTSALGVDGCGVPTMRTDVRSLALAFARLASDPDLAEVSAASARFAALTSDGDRPEAEVARWVPAVVKGGAMGCAAAGWLEGGVGFAAKAWTGDATAASIALLALIDRMGILSEHQREMLGPIGAPAVLGGGRTVGHHALAEP